jgi:hypothetical protein
MKLARSLFLFVATSSLLPAIALANDAASVGPTESGPLLVIDHPFINHDPTTNPWERRVVRGDLVIPASRVEADAGTSFDPAEAAASGESIHVTLPAGDHAEGLVQINGMCLTTEPVSTAAHPLRLRECTGDMAQLFIRQPTAFAEGHARAVLLRQGDGVVGINKLPSLRGALSLLPGDLGNLYPGYISVELMQRDAE